MLTVTTALLVLGLLLATLLYAGQRGVALERAARADGSFGRQFVWVEDDGTARELNAEELALLNTEFLPTDGARPYFKDQYATRSHDARLSGFLLRSRLPQHVAVRG